ncbi:proteoglycan 4-like [Mercenaria mercenaria]|uniref:proteoglycan 4-like n=1 Tax=Mercenaria mercenaria TaxID=6596 RepID=UPI00234EF1FF|nr:proteoglycan 4-like [Mercenaria mercenaria]
MKGHICSLLALLVIILQSAIANAQTTFLTCKKCDRVSSLDSCSGSVKCADDEICYMDELITDQSTVVYTGGCRSKVVCKAGVSGSPSVGKRGLQKRSDLVACSRCCDIKKKSGALDCNARLCGIKYTDTNSTRCYLCDNNRADAEQGDVDIPQDCLSETTCQPNEACGSERLDLSGKDSHKYTCLPKRICTLLTKESLKRKDECVTNPDPAVCGNVGTGKRAATNQCTACCGDGLCNSGTCEQVIDRLYNLWKGGALDFDTLKQKSQPTTTAPIATNPPTPATTKSTQPPPPTKPPTTQPPATTQTTQPPPTKPPTTQPPVTTQTTQPPPTKPPTTQPPVTTQTTQPPPTKPPTTQPPVTTKTTQPPTTQPPVTTQTTQPPTTTQTTQPPITTQTTQPPVTTQTTQPPVTTQTTQPPVTTQKTQAPVTTQPPATTQPIVSSPAISVSAAPQTPATAAVVVSQASSTVAPNSPPTITPNTVVPPNTTAIVG